MFKGIKARLVKIMRRSEYGEGKFIQYSVNCRSLKFRASTYSEWSRAINIPGAGRRTLSPLLNELRSSDILFDIGANVGVSSCLAGASSNCEVHSFEPGKNNFEVLQVHHEINRINGRCHQIGLWDENLQSCLSNVDLKGHQLSAGDGVYRINSDLHVNTGSEVVNLRTGDSLVSEGKLPIPNVLMLDCEGAEVRVLKGLKETLCHSRCRTIFVDVHIKKGGNSIELFGNSVQEIEDILRHSGFDLKTIPPVVKDNENYSIVGTKRSV